MLEAITQFTEVDEDGRVWVVSKLAAQTIAPVSGSKVGFTTEIEKAVTGLLFGKTGQFS